MASAVFYTSMNSSPALFSRTHFPNSISKDFSDEFLNTHQVNYYLPARKIGSLKRVASKVRAAVTDAPVVSQSGGENLREGKKKLKILVAGGGIGGLVFALAARRKGFEVVVFERDLTAIRGEGQYRGPIQIQSNALAALEAIDWDVADEVMKAGCITGDRINGLVDGVSGNWYCKFDTFTPAAERGLPVTRVVSRMTLQKILATAVGDEIICNGSNVVDFEDDGKKVTVILEDGQRCEGDLLVGADGIWSKVRRNLFGYTEPTYSGYTCYTGIADFVPADIDTVGYRVFLGHKQYFVSSDVGGGKMQWYAFYNEPAGGKDKENGKKERLLQIFGGWCDNVIDLLMATDEEAILRRDIYDREPTFNWGKGRITLLGDSVHAMQPNLGQGGCMAIEDSYQLAMELDKAYNRSAESGNPIDIESSLRSYESSRKIRVSVIHGLARMAAIMASTYKAYLGVGLGPLSFLTKLRIPHPGRVGGRFFIDIGMPLMLSWVLGGNGSNLEGRPLQCRLSDRANSDLKRWFEDDDALERATKGEWVLFPVGNTSASSEAIFLSKDEGKPCIVGSVLHPNIPGTSIAIPSPQVSSLHAKITCKNGAFSVTDLRSEHGTYLSDNEGRRYRIPPNFPTRFHPSDIIGFGSDEKVAFRVKVMKFPSQVAENTEGSGALQAV
ncbi:zeaxanthin epoxidase, chloroplastic [Daucus carota subsp. sativus]|uniref:Zeaxanthin epoxidase, chloroplastic n=1 Tax=Daucus carota subsp. sativus TaxID=79200 RepID=Q2VEX1_DAUCS|nr:zeaxanthin epoxidase, chloroplastic [Daucus carota]ABB52077.1 putative zeaxanthin epoxidase [Daucus carota subsp. sativus]